MICVIRHLALTVSNVCLKLGCFQNTSTYSTLEESHVMRYIKSRLTYLVLLKISTAKEKNVYFLVDA